MMMDDRIIYNSSGHYSGFFTWMVLASLDFIHPYNIGTNIILIFSMQKKLSSFQNITHLIVDGAGTQVQAASLIIYTHDHQGKGMELDASD